ncbi:putative RNA-directed DNA polymerase [Tanacetum coccineum]
MAGDDAAKNKNEGESIDHNSPFYLHASDYPKQMHVNEVLTDKNYSDWEQEMMNFLFAKNKTGFIDGTIEKPEVESDRYLPWMRCDAMIKAMEIWEDLKERFGKESAPKAYELKQALNTTRQDNTTVSAYYTKLRVLWDEMESILPTPRCSCDGCSCELAKKLTELKETERTYEFLMGLDDQFSVFKTQILAMKPTPKLSTVYHPVAEDEQQRMITSSNKPVREVAAFQASLQGRRDQTRNQQEKGWTKNKKGSQVDKTEQCSECGRDGHKKDGCFKIIGYPEWWPGKGKGDKPRPRAAMVETKPCPIPGMTEEQYAMFLKLFGEN